jgi:hypothetical protein
MKRRRKHRRAPAARRQRLPEDIRIPTHPRRDRPAPAWARLKPGATSKRATCRRRASKSRNRNSGNFHVTTSNRGFFSLSHFGWTLSPGERTNILIELTGMTTLAVTSFDYPRSLSKRFIALYVDQPGGLAHAVMRAGSGGLRAAIA